MNPEIEKKIRLEVRKIISESILSELDDEKKWELMSNNTDRVKFSKDLMKQAIEQGREIAMNFQSNNSKYKMPIYKTRIIHPVAMGYDKNGNLVVRGLHVAGQSEKEAIKTGIRSAEASAEKDGVNAWRLFNTNNIQTMWFTNRFFNENIPGYNPSDSAMSSTIATYNPAKAKEYQDRMAADDRTDSQKIGDIPYTRDLDQMSYQDNPIQEKNIRNLFK